MIYVVVSGEDVFSVHRTGNDVRFSITSDKFFCLFCCLFGFSFFFSTPCVFLAALQNFEPLSCDHELDCR